MLIKLRNKFLFLMFGLTSAGLITAFLAVYAISYFKTASEINDKLNFHEELEVTAAGSVALGSEKADAVIINRIFPDRGIYFNLLTNEKGKVLAIEIKRILHKQRDYILQDFSDEELVKFLQYLERLKERALSLAENASNAGHGDVL